MSNRVDLASEGNIVLGEKVSTVSLNALFNFSALFETIVTLRKV